MNTDRFRFRAWIQAIKEMNYTPRLLIDPILQDPGDWNHLILMQCTGLKDSEDRLIWESDIVEEQGTGIGKKVWKHRNTVCIGAYNNGEDYENNISGYGVYLKHAIFLRGGKKEEGWDDSDICDCHGLSKMKVIGSIYEHPELLEGEKETKSG